MVIRLHTEPLHEVLAALPRSGIAVQKLRRTSLGWSLDATWISKPPSAKCGRKNTPTPRNRKSRRRPKLSKKVRTSNGR